jgi:hypothetical protein
MEFQTPQKELKRAINEIVTKQIIEAGIETRFSVKATLNKMINKILKEADDLEWKSKGEAIKTAIELEKLGRCGINSDEDPKNLNINLVLLQQKAKELLTPQKIEEETKDIIEAQYEVVNDNNG